MSDKTASDNLTGDQRIALCQAIGHMGALVATGSIHAQREARFVRDLIAAFGLDCLRANVSECYEAEVSA